MHDPKTTLFLLGNAGLPDDCGEYAVVFQLPGGGELPMGMVDTGDQALSLSNDYLFIADGNDTKIEVVRH